MNEEKEQKTFYSNRTAVFTSANDFIFKFQVTVPQDTVDKKNEKIEYKVVDEIVIATSPQQFKRIFSIMKGQIEFFEENFGPITIVQKKENAEEKK